MCNKMTKEEVHAKEQELKFEQSQKTTPEAEEEKKNSEESDCDQDIPDEGEVNTTQGRGSPWIPSDLMANLVLVYGCPPSKFVLADTRMLHDFFETLENRYNQRTLAVELPQMLDDLDNESMHDGDAKWELMKSNQIQKVRIFFENNKVTKKRAVIFVTTHVKNKYSHLTGDERDKAMMHEWANIIGPKNKKTPEEMIPHWHTMSDDSKKKQEPLVSDLVNADAEKRAKIAEDVLKTHLGFEDIEIYRDESKEFIDAKLSELKNQALDFEREYVNQKATQCFAVIHVGTAIDPLSTSKGLLTARKFKAPPKQVGAYEAFFELTKDGEAMNLNEKAAWITDTREVQPEYRERMN